MNWYLIHSKAGREVEASKRLHQQSFISFLPLIKKPVRKGRDRIDLVDRPLFPRYLFAQCEAKSLNTVRSTRGVSSIVQFGEEPCLVPDSVIEEIQTRMVEGYVMLCEVPICPFKKGETVIYDGLTEIEAIFDSRIGDSDRVIILMKMFDRPCLVPVSLTDIRPVYA